MKSLLLSLALVAACFGTNTLPEPVSPAALNAKPLANRPTLEYSSPRTWYASPYFRITDTVMDWPVLLVVATDGTACLVDGGTWALAHSRQIVQCRSGWRMPRP